MGKWKYLNWLIVIIILLHMYRYFFLRYEASPSIYILATAGWLVMTAFGYYIFVHNIYQTRKTDKKPIKEAQTPKFTKERPKVVFKKKDQHSK